MSSFKLDLDKTTDEDFFGSLKASKSSKLRQLFVDNGLPLDDKEQSLKYQRPKDVQITPNATRNTLMAIVVTAYREGDLQGKVGLALIENPDNSCSIIVYKSKSQILATLELQPGRESLYKQTNYWQFYDETSIYWSFSFDTATDEEEFVDKLYMRDIIFRENKEIEEEKVGEKHLGVKKAAHEVQGNAVEDSTTKTAAGATKETRTSLIKRMAKMGKPLPTLPLSNHQTTTEFSDSSDTEVIKTPGVSNLKSSVVARSNKMASSKSHHQVVPAIVGFNSVSNTTSGAYPINPLESQYMQMLLTEQRTQGSELRMSMNKLENKIEKVLDKIEICGRKDGNQNMDKEDEILEMEGKLLMLRKENRKLKQSLQENVARASEETKGTNLLYEFKEDLDHFNIDYKQELKDVFIALIYNLKEGHIKIREMQQKQDENELKLKHANMELELKTSKNNELEKTVSSLKQHNSDLQLELMAKTSELTKQTQEVLDLQEKSQQPSDTALVKSIMNKLYVDIADQLSNTNLTHTEQILSLIASSIKQQTLQCLQQSMPTSK